MAGARSARDRRRASLGQNFLVDRGLVRRLCSLVRSGDVVVDLGAGGGGIALELARRGAAVVAIEADPVWAERLRADASRLQLPVEVIVGDAVAVPLPPPPYRVVASPPFNRTTALLRRLLTDPRFGPESADLILQWEVARKRAASPPTTALSAAWAPWWEFELVERVPATSFRPVPSVDAGWLRIRRRRPALLPTKMAARYARFVESSWTN